MKYFPISYKSLSRTKNLVLLLLIIFPFTFQSNLMAIEASRFKKDVTREYNTCEKKRKILDKAVCMTVLRSRLENDLEYDSKQGYYYRNSYGNSGLIIRHQENLKTIQIKN